MKKNEDEMWISELLIFILSHKTTEVESIAVENRFTA